MENIKKTVVLERLQWLRNAMIKNQIDYYIIPTTDYHQSEYVSAYFKVREYFSGFTGSNGTLVVGKEDAGLWTDGRYFVQAEKELEGTGIMLFPMDKKNVPTIIEYIKKHGKKDQVVAFDGKILNAEYGEWISEEFTTIGMQTFWEKDIAGSAWKDRPNIIHNPILILEKSLCGESALEKVRKIRKEMEIKKTDIFLLSKLDDIMWLFNIRGTDIEYNLVAFAHAMIFQKEIYLFLGKEALTKEFLEYAKENNIILKRYADVERVIQNIRNKTVFLDKSNSSFAFYKTVCQKNKVLSQKNLTEIKKSIKNEVEIKNIKEVYRNDSVAVCKFLYWLQNEVGKNEITEVGAAEYLNSLRKQTNNFMELSFPTISAYGENAAMMHYSASNESNKILKTEGAFLVDSGGQYLGGTTDVTRTIVLGETSKEFKQDFTAVVSGMLQLQSAVFLEGCTGRNLDILARQPLWDMHLDYKCGTGHGIGYMLNVHEGPQGIRWKYNETIKETAIKPGMIISNEPGVYKEGKYGIRIENILLCVFDEENTDGTFLKFEPLTLVPIDTNGIARECMSEQNKKRINIYHKMVYTEICDLLNENEKQWLQAATEELK